MLSRHGQKDSSEGRQLDGWAHSFCANVSRVLHTGINCLYIEKIEPRCLHLLNLRKLKLHARYHGAV